LSGWKEWDIGEVVEAAEFQSFVQDQIVQKYADAAARGSALGTAVAEGMISYLSDSDSVEYYDGAAWAPIAVDAAWVTSGTAGQILRSNGSADPSWAGAESTLAAGTQGFTALSNGTAGLTYQPVSHNYIINGAFDVWQRGTSFASTGFTSDRWRTSDGFPTATVAQGTATPADISAIGYGEPQFFFKYSNNAATTGLSLFEQRVEDVRSLAGQTVTLSYYAKVSAGTAENVPNFVQNFGSGGSSAVVTTSPTTATITTSWQRFSHTIALPDISGKTIGAGSYLSVRPLRHSTSTSLTYDIWGVQLEAGSVATPFKRHAPSLQGELAACQRYYLRIFPAADQRVLGNGWGNTTTTARGAIPFPVQMRTDPTSLEQSGTAGDYQIQRQGTNAVTCSAIPSFVTATQYAAQVQFTVASGLTAGEGLQLRTQTANAFLGWSAEL
jgi:hypothetical protein